MGVDTERLARFLVKAKKGTYASTDSQGITSERPGHKELEFEEEGLYYRDSYVGFFQAPGMEEVRLGKAGETIWTMAYSGGMLPEFQESLDFAKRTFGFLKKALEMVQESAPFRGPGIFEEGDWKYTSEIEGDIKRFLGHEKIFYKGKEVFSQDYAGGIVISK
jgi:hypothetical protein